MDWTLVNESDGGSFDTSRIRRPDRERTTSTEDVKPVVIRLVIKTAKISTKSKLAKMQGLIKRAVEVAHLLSFSCSLFLLPQLVMCSVTQFRNRVPSYNCPDTRTRFQLSSK